MKWNNENSTETYEDRISYAIYFWFYTKNEIPSLPNYLEFPKMKCDVFVVS